MSDCAGKSPRLFVILLSSPFKSRFNFGLYVSELIDPDGLRTLGFYVSLPLPLMPVSVAKYYESALPWAYRGTGGCFLSTGSTHYNGEQYLSTSHRSRNDICENGLKRFLLEMVF